MKLNVLLSTVNQVKIWHWQTRIPEHEMFGELYDTLNGLVDRFVEASLGIQGTRQLDFPLRMELVQFKNVEASINFLKKFREFLVSRLLEGAEHTELLQLRDDMLEAVDLALYKLIPQ